MNCNDGYSFVDTLGGSMARKISQLLLCWLALFVTHLSASEASLDRAAPEELGFSSQRIALAHEMLMQHVEDGRVAGLVAGVARHGKIVYLESMGWNEIAQGNAMQDDSIFQIRSMSKPITAVAAMQLVEQGRMNLSDPVSKYIPSFGVMEVFLDPDNADVTQTRPSAREMTIEDLLLNTAGLSHRFGALYRENEVRSRADTLPVLVEKVAGVPLIGDPGEQWVYSISITVLGRIIEIVSGQDFDDYLQQHIYEPLKMIDTGFYVPDKKAERLARAYRVSPDDRSLTLLPPMDIPITVDPPLLEGAAGIVSTVPDYLRFLQALQNDGELEGRRILQRTTVETMTQNQVPELMPFGTNPDNPMLDRGWGYGMAVVVNEELSAYGTNNGEFGWSGSLGTFSWADPVSGTSVVIMLQIQPAGAYNIAAKFKTMVHQSMID
jgi:CubicO group peptidase (beta-lactamase class C family)